MICKLSNTHTMALLWNSKNKHNSYIMIYNYKTDSRLYSVDIKDIPDSYNRDIVQLIIDNTPNMCKFSETMINSQKVGDTWMLDDLQNFANAIDEYDLE